MSLEAQQLDDVYRTSRAWAELGTECFSLPFGRVVTHPAFPAHHEGNCIWDVRLAPQEAARAFQQVKTFFADRGLICFHWVAALEQPLAILADVLEPEGYTLSVSQAMVLGYQTPVNDLPCLNMVSARSHPETYEAVFRLAGQRFSLNMAPIHLKRLYSPHYEVYTALLDGEPVGKIGLLTVGGVGRVKNVFVGGDYRRAGVASAMLSFIVDKCRQQGSHVVCLEVDADNSQALRCYERFGFRTIGTLQTFTHR